jgi:small-conductance mechanosensitive channel
MFREAGISVPYPHRDVTVRGAEAFPLRPTPGAG